MEIPRTSTTRNEGRGPGEGFRTFQTFARGWLEAHGDHTSAHDLSGYADAEAAGRLYTAWLEAGGHPMAVQQSVRRWLAGYGTTEVAGFVYKAWLNAGGRMSVVSPQVLDWIARHASSADHVLVAYLDRGGPFPLVRDAALTCMTRLRESADGSFVSKALAKRASLSDEVVLAILAWCRHFAHEGDALWRLSQLGEKLARPGVAEEACAVAELLLEPWLDPQSSPDRDVANNAAHVLAFLGSIHDPRLRARAYALLLRWLRHPNTFSRSTFCRRPLVPRLLTHVGVLLECGAIDLTADGAALARFEQWAVRCDPETMRPFAPLQEWFRRRVLP